MWGIWSGKNPHLLLPAMREVLDENAGLRIWIVGDGPLRPILEQIAYGDERIEFLGMLEPREVCRRLQYTRVFVSGSPTEPFGITYLEALSQGCAVVMPACGGGLEIALEQVGGRIQLFSCVFTSRREIASAMRRALLSSPKAVDLTDYSARAVARAYLNVDARFDTRGIFHAESCNPLGPAKFAPFQNLRWSRSRMNYSIEADGGPGKYPQAGSSTREVVAADPAAHALFERQGTLRAEAEL